MTNMQHRMQSEQLVRLQRLTGLEREKIARESSKAVNGFNKYSEVQLRKLKLLYIDARANIQGQIFVCINNLIKVHITYFPRTISITSTNTSTS